MSTASPLLRIDGVTVRFGGIVALDGVSFDVRQGDICALIGPNGAGKSTLFNCLSRLYDCERGSLEFNGQSITRLPRHRMAELGIGRTFQNLALFGSMTVRDNVLVGCHSQHHAGFLRNALRLPGVARIEAAAAEQADSLIELLGLQAEAQRVVADLPFGTQKRVELARALAMAPKLLLLDEPACGLNHEELDSLGALIRQIRDRLNITVLLVEQNIHFAQWVSDRAYVLEKGQIRHEAPMADLARDQDIQRQFLSV